MTSHTNVAEACLHFIGELCRKAEDMHQSLEAHGIYSVIQMRSAGFHYTGVNDTTLCQSCNLEVSGWTKDMIPSLIHAQRSPTCSFVQSHLLHHLSQDDKHDKKSTITDPIVHQHYRLIEVNKLEKIRRRTFSHWKWPNKPSADQMIAAGFFSCNVHDRTICLYCHLICHQWILDIDDPTEVHKTLSSQCPYVRSMLIYPSTSTTVIVINDTSMTSDNTRINNRYDHIDYTNPCHPTYSDITRRLQSFTTCSSQSISSLPPIDDLARAGFFYVGIRNVVTCFYCNGSLDNWGVNDQPMIEHARWFEHCIYAKQLCGDQLYQQIQVAKRHQQRKIISMTSFN